MIHIYCFSFYSLLPHGKTWLECIDNIVLLQNFELVRLLCSFCRFLILNVKQKSVNYILVRVFFFIFYDFFSLSKECQISIRKNDFFNTVFLIWCANILANESYGMEQVQRIQRQFLIHFLEYLKTDWQQTNRKKLLKSKGP